jgi:hypothetical protein
MVNVGASYHVLSTRFEIGAMSKFMKILPTVVKNLQQFISSTRIR